MHKLFFYDSPISPWLNYPHLNRETNTVGCCEGLPRKAWLIATSYQCLCNILDRQPALGFPRCYCQ